MPVTDPATFPEPIELVADVAAEGVRVDRFLADAIGSMSRSRVKRLIVEGRLAGKGACLADPAEGVRAGARYVLHLPAPVAATPAAQAVPFTILYEDSDLIVLDK